MKTSPRNKLNKIGLATIMLLAAGTAWAAIQNPTHPGDYIYYYNASNQIVGAAWIGCNSTSVEGWGERTGRSRNVGMWCPPGGGETE